MLKKVKAWIKNWMDDPIKHKDLVYATLIVVAATVAHVLLV